MHADQSSNPLATAALHRRSVLRGLFLGLGAAALPGWMQSARAAGGGPEIDIPTGPLANIGPVEKKTLTGGALAGIDDQVFAPAGFNVRVVARAGVNPLTGTATGFTWHVNPDGGAVFPSKSDGGWVYVSNSETTPGGVGALRFSADGTLISAYRILDGTRNNCAGGPTPWGTWLSCEETANGEVFECDPFGSAATAVKKPALGAFPHEAAAIDPINHVCYLTEDGGSQRFWRFVTNASDRTTMADGTVRLALTSGVLQVLNIEGFANGGAPTDANLREAKRATWVTVTTPPVVPGVPPAPQQPPTSTTMGTSFNGGEGIWYHEIPPALRSIPALGSVPTRGVIFFATKGTNRIHAYDIENQLIETIFDNANMQITTGFDDVDNVTVSPAGDVLVSEDGTRMRISVIVPNKPSKLLMQITRGGSEICGPAFTPDGSRLYFSSQRGPSGVAGAGASGATFEMTIPEEFRSLTPPVQLPDAFTYIERSNVAHATLITSEVRRIAGITRAQVVSITAGAEYRANGGAWTQTPGTISAGHTLEVRHLSPTGTGTVRESTVTVGGYSTVFRTVNSNLDRTPDAFNFGTQTGVAASTLVESAVITIAGYNTAVPVSPGAGLAYRINGGSWQTGAGTLRVGETVQVRHTSNRESLGYTKSPLRVGGVTGYFTTRTR